jgi:hypothetical protein
VARERSARQLPTASETHFLVKLALAAPASFFAAAEASQDFLASVSHFFMKLVLAAPASFFWLADTLQVGFCAYALPAIAQSNAINAIRFIAISS